MLQINNQMMLIKQTEGFMIPKKKHCFLHSCFVIIVYIILFLKLSKDHVQIFLIIRKFNLYFANFMIICKGQYSVIYFKNNKKYVLTCNMFITVRWI